MHCFSKDLFLSVQTENIGSRRNIQEPLHQPESQHALPLIRKRRQVSVTEALGKTWQAALEPDSSLFMYKIDSY